MTKRWKKRLAGGVLVVIVLLGLGWFQTRNMARGQAPLIDAGMLDGGHFSSRQALGKPLLVHFWASWCGICRLEESTIVSLSRKYRVITIAMQSGNADAVRGYMEKRKLKMPVVVDERGILARRYGVNAVPVSFIVDGHGRIRNVTRGYSTWIGLRLRLWYASWF